MAFSADGGFSDSNPLTPLHCAAGMGRVNALLPTSPPRGVRGHVNAAGPGAKLEAPSAAKDHHERSCEHPSGALPPAGQRGQSPHVFTGVRREHRLDPSFARCSRAPSGPRALARLLQVHVSASTTADHWNIPDRRGRQLGRLPGSIEGRPSTQGNRRSFSGSGVEDNRCLDTPHRDCSRWRLRPDPDRFGPPLVASIHPSSPVRNDVGREGCRRRRARLQSVRGERVVRRPPSAKKTCAHQPEGPSVARPLAMRAGRSSRAWPEPGTGVTPAPFSPSFGPVRGTLARVGDGSAFAQGEWRTTLVGDGPQRP